MIWHHKLEMWKKKLRKSKSSVFAQVVICKKFFNYIINTFLTIFFIFLIIFLISYTSNHKKYYCIFFQKIISNNLHNLSYPFNPRANHSAKCSFDGTCCSAPKTIRVGRTQNKTTVANVVRACEPIPSVNLQSLRDKV